MDNIYDPADSFITVNTGGDILSFSAFWPADAGHDYATISEEDFSMILVQKGENLIW